MLWFVFVFIGIVALILRYVCQEMAEFDRASDALYE